MKEIYPLSKTEEGIYVSCLKETDAYNLTNVINLGSNLDVSKFIKALNKVFEAHPYLFTVLIQDENGIIYKKIEKEIIDINVENINNIDFKPYYFELLNKHLYHLHLYKYKNDYYFYYDFHHIIFDGTSLKLFTDELIKSYEGKKIDSEEYNANLYSVDEEKALKTKEYDNAKNYYEKLIVDSDVDSTIVYDKNDGKNEYKNYITKLKIKDSDIKKLTHKLNIKTSSFHLASFSYLLSKINMDDKALFLTVNNGRNEKLNNSVGMYVKTYPFYLEYKERIEDYLLCANDEQIGNVKNLLYPFSSLVKDLGITANIIFAYQGDYFYKTIFNGKELYINPIERKDGKENISIELHRDSGEYIIWVEYRSDLYEDNTIKHLVSLFDKVESEFLIKDRLDDINLITDDEYKLLEGFNNVDPSYVDFNNTILDSFKNASKNYPDNYAVVFKDKKYTYKEVDLLSNKLGNELISYGIKKEDVVSILIKKSEYIVIASLGVIKSGCAYQPLDPTYPEERLNFMVKDSSAKVLILDRDLDNIIDFKGKKIYIDEINNFKNENDTNIKLNPNDLFIMLYTSGSTGLPKGVMLEHGNINTFVSYYNKAFDVTSDSHMAAYASYGFDADMMDLYPALASGATVYVIPEELRLDLVKLGNFYNENKITHSLITTQVGRQFASEIDVKYLKHFFVGGEKLVPIEPPKNYIFHNAYGPTEGTVFCTEKIVDKLYYRVPIGPNLNTYKFYVLDKNMKRLPTLVSGELYIAGPQVARGYLNRDKENKEAFLTNPFDKDPVFKRLYKTGDIVRLLPNGDVDFIGRKDGQVKIRGFRVELTEVEKIIREYPNIKDATVKDFTDPAGVKFICAYIVSNEKIDVNNLNKYIASKKPPYMVPAYTMQIDKIPLNQNQKVNKRALPLPELKEVERIMPENDLERDIYNILKDVLGHESFGVTTNIYEAGLTSVSSIRLTILLSKKFNCDVSIDDLNNNQTIRELIKALGNKDEDIKFERLNEYPITKTQEGIFVESVSIPDSTTYNIPYLFKLSDKIDLGKLKDAIIKTINNHEYLKTNLYMDDSGDIKAKREEKEAIVSILSVDKLDKNTLIRPFDILNGDLYRAEIYKTKEANYLYLDFHHIICDGTSEAIILNDINKAYLGSELIKEEYTGFEVALNERELLKTDKLEKAKDFINNYLKDIDGEYLIKKDLKVSKNSKLKSIDFNLNVNLNNLKKFIDSNKLTFNAYFNFAFAFTLSKYLYKYDSLYVTIYNGRNSSKLNNTVSMLVKTLPVYMKYNEEDNVLLKLNEMKENLIGLQANDLYSFSDIVKAYDIKADVMFAYQGDNFTFDKIGGEKVDAILLESDTPKSVFGLDIFLENNVFRAHFEYDEAIYNENTINSFKRLYELILNELMIKKIIKEINLLPEEDLKYYKEFNSSKEPIPNISFNKLIEKQAELNPDRIAVIGKGGEFTYKVFNENCNKVANMLIDEGVKLTDRVVMLMPRIALAYVVRQGIIKSGGAFVPIDPKYPMDRIEYIITNSEAKYLISTKEIIDGNKELIEKTKIKAFDILDIMKSNKINNPNVLIPSDSLCYIIYTSGSTGKPKGVMINHHNLVNYVLDGSNIGTKLYRNIGTNVVGCSFSSFSFDASLQEECVPLSHGYTAVIATEEEIENPLKLAETLNKYHVNIMFMTPSFVSNFIDIKEFVEALKNFKVLDMGAEAVPLELCQKLRKLGITAELYNGYGPTETTITCTYHHVTDEYVTIGKPFANTEIYMLDKAGHILPINAIGDLTIAGDSVGMGYLGLPEKTKENFIEIFGKRAYRSGDLARYNNDGNVEFFGRLDNQVKLRGLRVELDEIEKVLNSYPNISRSIILVKTNQVDGDYLAAYFTASKEIDKDDLTRHMAKSLTPYMIPKVMMQLDKIPLTPNGKIDKKALPEIEVKKEIKDIKKASNALEEKLCKIFAKALGQDSVGIDDDFFDLGGTSLSASKVAMLAIKENLPIAYKDIFEYSTVLELERHINSLNGENKIEEDNIEEFEFDSLKFNNVKYINEINEERPLGNILLTGATGFLGIHVFKELLNLNKKMYLLIRNKGIDTKKRLEGLVTYYFDEPFSDLIDKYVTIIDADIVDKDLYEKLNDIEIDTIINCAAIVKHFSSDDIIERINVGGVNNLIDISFKKNARLIQISTLSVAGENIDNKFDESFKIKENMLSFGQDISNKYVNSKFNAEKNILKAIDNGLDAKIIRVGNLMGRNSDGEFQANSITNGFMRDLRGYAVLHKFPVNSMDIEVDFSPIDEVAKTILKLSTTNKKFTVFHSANSHMIQMGDIIYTMNLLGFDIKVVSDDEFIESMKEMMQDEENNMLVSSLISYSSSDTHVHSFIGSNNEFTNKALYHLNYKWPITDKEYLTKAIESLMTLGFFERKDQ
ncbi:MAG: amino acid adenylation domain-containing protein [Acholeplasmatales bacterium]|nr:amino acid adenylation domain-containing protein [Acholeplasmatales bacterium]